MTKLKELGNDECEYADALWNLAHSEGVPATGLGQALLLAATHLYVRSKGLDFRDRAIAQADLARLDDLATQLYERPISPISANVAGFGPHENSTTPLTEIRQIGIKDAESNQLRFEVNPGQELASAARAAFIPTTSEPDSFNTSRWATAERHYWEGVSRVLAYDVVAHKGLAEAIREEVNEARRNNEAESVVLRYRLAAMKVLASLKPEDNMALSKAVYAASIAEEMTVAEANISLAVAREALATTPISQGRGRG